MNYSNVNKELLLGFVDESIDALSEADTFFVELEKKPHDREIINTIFRPIHSLKGNAAYFGLMRLKKFAHMMESFLDSLRKGTKKVDRNVINTLLPGMDQLREILLNVREDRDEVTDDKKYSVLFNNIEVLLNDIAPVASGDIASDIDASIEKLQKTLKGVDAEQFEKLLTMLKSMPSLSGLNRNNKTSDSNGHNINDDMRRLIRSISERLVLTRNGENTSHDVDLLRTQLDQLGKNCETDSQKTIVLEITDLLETFTNSDVGIDGLAESLILEQLHALESGSTKKYVQSVSEEHGDKISGDTKLKTDKTMRIPERALDDFLRSVGELLGIEEMLRHLQRRCIEGDDNTQIQLNLKEAIGQFEAISGELRSKIMEIRKVEAKVLLQKVPRIIRDIATGKEKKINAICVGDTVAIDKSYIDILDAPLTHMVRNAADHGIEMPAERVDKGKDETGTVTVSLIENEDILKLIIQDDGAGLNYEGIHRKAVELGLIDKNNQLTIDQVTELLFYSGVSTASEVTDISGRGVGMDIVKKTITDAGGKVEVESIAGAGTTFTILLPRNASTQILDGYIIESFSGEIYVVPLNNVIEAFRIEPEQITNVAGKSTMVQRRGSLNPLYTIDNLLGLAATNNNLKVNERCMGVLIETKKERSVIAVREIVGIQKIVSKKIEGGLLESTQFDGAAVSGTGHIYLIVNVEKLLE
jgi:two-component system chemotaxis sensor kinase CheA